MQIRFYANFRTITKHAMLEFNDTDVYTLRDLFQQLIMLFPDIAPHLLVKSGDLRPDVPIFVNGRNPRLADAGLDSVLEPDDVISLFSPIASGRMNVESIRDSASGEEE